MTVASTPFEQRQWALQQVGDATRALRDAERVLEEYTANPSIEWERLTFHYLNTANPHGVTKAQVGLDQVMNYLPASEQVAINGVSSTAYLTPLSGKALIDSKLNSLNGLVGANVNPSIITGHILVDPAAATYNSKSIASATDIGVAPLGVDRMSVAYLTLTKTNTGAPVVRLGSDVNDPVGIKLAGSADDSPAGTYLYTIYVGYGVPLAYRVEAMA